MIYKTPSPIPGHIRIVFELPPCIWANHIAVAGDFNHWSPTSTPMRQNRDGVWQATIDLLQGSQCEFRYLVDGEWMTDYHADGFAPNRFGSDNSLVLAALSTDNLLIQRETSMVWNGHKDYSYRPFRALD
jgi:hypothetical protein